MPPNVVVTLFIASCIDTLNVMTDKRDGEVDPKSNRISHRMLKQAECNLQADDDRLCCARS